MPIRVLWSLFFVCFSCRTHVVIQVNFSPAKVICHTWSYLPNSKVICHIPWRWFFSVSLFFFSFFLFFLLSTCPDSSNRTPAKSRSRDSRKSPIMDMSLILQFLPVVKQSCGRVASYSSCSIIFDPGFDSPSRSFFIYPLVNTNMWIACQWRVTPRVLFMFIPCNTADGFFFTLNWFWLPFLREVKTVLQIYYFKTENFPTGRKAGWAWECDEHKNVLDIPSKGGKKYWGPTASRNCATCAAMMRLSCKLKVPPPSCCL